MLNRVLLIGNLGRDPEVKFTGNGKALCTFSVVTSEQWTDADGQRQERTEWHRVVVWGKQAEACGRHLTKGRQVYVEGALRSREYQAKDGTKKTVVEVVAQRVQFLGGGKGTEGAAAREPGSADELIPF